MLTQDLEKELEQKKLEQQDKVDQPYTEAAINIEQGFTPNAEIWNGRFAMLGFLSILIIEVLSGQGIVDFWASLLSNLW